MEDFEEYMDELMIESVMMKKKDEIDDESFRLKAKMYLAKHP